MSRRSKVVGHVDISDSDNLKLASHVITIITRTTKSQKFSAFIKVYETCINQISRSYHEETLSY